MNSVSGEIASTAPSQGAPAGSSSSPALHDLGVRPIPFGVARALLVRHHYLHSMPGGTKLAFGVFVGRGLLGAITLGVGPYLGYRLVDGAGPEHYLTLTRLWLSDELPRNSESYVLGNVMRALKRNTGVKFLVTYSDPTQGHVGLIFQASNWLFSGPSAATPLYDIGDGIARHSRSLAHDYGSHSLRHFHAHDVDIKLVPQAAKHRYVYFLDPAWRCRLNVPVLPYPKKEVPHAGN